MYIKMYFHFISFFFFFFFLSFTYMYRYECEATEVSTFLKLRRNNIDDNEPPRGKNQQCGFRTDPTQTGLFKHRRWLEA